MTKVAIRIALVLPIVVLAPSIVEAAKGVQKVASADGQKVVTGIVVSMTPNGSGGGTFHVKAATPHRRMGTVSTTGSTTANAAKLKQTEFTVNSSTRFEHYNGVGSSLTNGSALQRGSRVRVMATGQQAQRVQIFTPRRSTSNFTRHRTSAYRPHLNMTHRRR